MEGRPIRKNRSKDPSEKTKKSYSPEEDPRGQHFSNPTAGEIVKNVPQNALYPKQHLIYSYI
jgi:hypothetical protein